MFIHVYIHTQIKYLYKVHEKRKKSSAEAKDFHGQLTPIGHSQTQILELKKDYIPIKKIFAIKTSSIGTTTAWKKLHFIGQDWLAYDREPNISCPCLWEIWRFHMWKWRLARVKRAESKWIQILLNNSLSIDRLDETPVLHPEKMTLRHILAWWEVT